MHRPISRWNPASWQFSGKRDSLSPRISSGFFFNSSEFSGVKGTILPFCGVETAAQFLVCDEEPSRDDTIKPLPADSTIMRRPMTISAELDEVLWNVRAACSSRSHMVRLPLAEAAAELAGASPACVDGSLHLDIRLPFGASLLYFFHRHPALVPKIIISHKNPS